MKEQLFTLPNIVTLCRLAALPVVWLWAFQGKPQWVGIGVFVLLLSDILDGLLARLLKQTTPLGAKLDSFADNLLVPSSLIWLLMLRPEILRGMNLMLFVVGAGSNILMQLATYFKFKRYPPNLHLYSAKASAVFGAIFIMHSLVFGLHPIMYYLAAGLFTLSNSEGLILVLTRSEVHEGMGSIFRTSSTGS
jgi:phosphatidylglycerophosphate synthase